MGIASLAGTTAALGTTILAGSSDIDEVIVECTAALRPHALRKRSPARLSTRLHHLPLGSDMSVSRLRYGADVVVVPVEPEEDNYLMTLPVSGHAEFTYGSELATATTRAGMIVSPYREFQFDISATFDQVIVRLDRNRVEAVAAMVTGIPGSVEFALGLNLPHRQFVALVEAAVGASDVGLPSMRPRLMWQLEQVIIESLILGQPNNRSASLESRTIATSRLRSAMDYMFDHLGDPLTVGQVAHASGTSVRALQEAFRRELSTTPLRWLRTQRLERAHSLLANAPPGALSVTEVAYDCGFSHLGEFGAAFKARFGMTPSAVQRHERDLR